MVRLFSWAEFLAREPAQPRGHRGTYMDEPPPGNFRDIMREYARPAEEIGATWDAIHGR